MAAGGRSWCLRMPRKGTPTDTPRLGCGPAAYPHPATTGWCSWPVGVGRVGRRRDPGGAGAGRHGGARRACIRKGDNMRGAHTRAAHAAPRGSDAVGSLVRTNETTEEHDRSQHMHSHLGTHTLVLSPIVSPTPFEREVGKKTHGAWHTSTRQSTQERRGSCGSVLKTALNKAKAKGQTPAHGVHAGCLPLPFYSHTLVTHPGEGEQQDGVQRISLSDTRTWTTL
jgi:hypothetical protein